MLGHYLRLIAFAVGLLLGVQVPGFVDQYAKRVSAHQIEVAQNFAGFQQTADQYFSGNVDALIAHHNESADLPFRDEGHVIQSMYLRLQNLSAELAAMQGPLIKQMFHVLFRPNREILAETKAAYSYTVPLSPAAIITGLAIGVALAALVESLLIGTWRLLRPRRRASPFSHPIR